MPQSFLFLFSALLLLSSAASGSVLIFRNGGNITADDVPVKASLEGFSSLWELADHGALHLNLLPLECSYVGNEDGTVPEYCRSYYFDIFNTYGEQIFKLEEIKDNDWLYIVPVTDHWIWPGHYVGRKTPLREISKEVGRDLFIETISVTPRIFQIQNWFSPEEAEQLIKVGEKYLEPSYMVKKDRGTYYESGRNSHQAWLKKDYHPIVNQTDERLGRFAHIPTSLHLEEQLQILHYEPNQHYYTHHDYFDRDPPSECNRFVTLLFYLIDVEEGGQTTFPLGNNTPYEELTFNAEDCHRGIQIQPLKYSLALFYNLEAESHMKGVPDEKTLHLGCDVLKGEKWAGNKWIHNKACHK